MALIQTEFDGGISYGSKEYAGPQTVQALMNTFDESYNRKHAQTNLTVFPRASIAKIKQDTVTGLHAWSELLSKEGISIQFASREIDARYPREAWIQLFLERGATIESLMDYFFCMAHRNQLAFLEDSSHLWKAETHGTSSTEAWETYKVNYIDRLARYYTQKWKAAAEATRKRVEISKPKAKTTNEKIKTQIEVTKSRIPKIPNTPTIPQVPKLNRELEETTLSLLQNLVNQLEETVKDLERQNRWDAAEEVKTVLEHVKQALAQIKAPNPSPNAPNRDEKKQSPYPPL